MFKENKTIFLNEACDNCPASGKFAAVKGKQMITLCAHCAREHETGLLKKNFSIFPPSYSFKAQTDEATVTP